MDIELRDLGQLLLFECRYGYTRNNHLMPAEAYDKVKKYIPEMCRIDRDYTLHTLQQLCEECISLNLLTNFYDGYDDEFGNRQRSIDFVKWCLEYIKNNGHQDYVPYNFDSFKEALEQENKPKYLVYEVSNDTRTLITPDPISKLDYENLIFLKDIPADNIIYFNKSRLDSDKKVSLKYTLKIPTDKVYIVESID